MTTTHLLIAAGAIFALVVLPVLAAWLRRPSTPVKVTVSEGAPLPVKRFTATDRPDFRTVEQKMADQADFDARGLPRGLPRP